MSSFAQALNIAIPVFVGLIALEYLYGYLKNKQTLNLPDTISSLSSGITNITKSVLGLGLSIISYDWIYNHFAYFKNLEVSWWMFPLVFIAKDFSGYWIHRFEHMVNYFWNRHIVHHSSEEFNLACALRQSISEIFGFSIFILFPLALVGIPPVVFSIVAPLHLFAQFWYHTQHINKMGFLEHILVTPSHHRVHHAINTEYLDKNFSQIFIVWDKWFGTFQEEMESVPPIYGVKRAVNTWNPILINFQHAWLVWTDFFRTQSWKDKLRIWFMPTGFRPADVADKYPVEVIENPYEQKKYMSPMQNWVKAWSMAQLVFILCTALYLFSHLSSFSWQITASLGALVFLSVFSYTSIMDGKKWAAIVEICKSLFFVAVLILAYNGQLVPFGVYIFALVYQVADIFLAAWFFTHTDRKVLDLV